MPKRQLHLNVNILHAGFYASAWRLPGSNPAAFTEIGHYVRTAQIAERGKLDVSFVETVIPILQRRGLFRRDYEGRTLREHFGLPRPANHFTAGAEQRLSA